MSVQSVRKRNGKGLNFENSNSWQIQTVGGITAISGAISFIIGAILWNLSGIDIDQAVTNGEMANFLTTASNNQTIVVAIISFWIVGALLPGVASNYHGEDFKAVWLGSGGNERLSNGRAFGHRRICHFITESSKQCFVKLKIAIPPGGFLQSTTS